MKKLVLIFFILQMNIYAFTWDECVKKYEKAKLFAQNIKLSYLYLKGTKSCLLKFKDFLIQNPNPEFTVEAMSDNILKIDEYINKVLPKYQSHKNHLETIPKYLRLNSSKPIRNKEYKYFKKYNNCNAIHAQNRIYTAKHCKVQNSKHLHYDLSYLESKNKSNLKIGKLDLNKKGEFKYYSMSKEGMFYNILLKEKNCKFYKAKNTANSFNKSLDLTDLTKKYEIRSTCLAIPSNSGGGVFQEGKLVAIISKTVFNNKSFSYSVIESIFPVK